MAFDVNASILLALVNVNAIVTTCMHYADNMPGGQFITCRLLRLVVGERLRHESFVTIAFSHR